MRILIAGATGNTGVGAVETLSKLGHEVIGISRDPTSNVSKRLAALPGVTIVTIEDAFNKPIDRAYSAFPPVRTLFSDETEFIRLVIQANVKYLVKLSTAENLMKDPLDSKYYARSHIAVEHILEQGKLPFTCLRANLFMNWLGFDLDEVKKTKKFVSLISDAPAAVIHPRDIGRAVATLLSLPDPSPHYGKKYNLSGPEDVTHQSLARDLSDVLQQTITLDHTSTEDDYVAGFVAMGLTPTEAGYMKKSVHLFSSGEHQLSRMPTSPAILALSAPSTTYKQYIKEYFAERKP